VRFSVVLQKHNRFVVVLRLRLFDVCDRYNQLVPGIVMAGAFFQAKVLAMPLLVKLGTE
jgi:hypothetical protein